MYILMSSNIINNIRQQYTGKKFLFVVKDSKLIFKLLLYFLVNIVDSAKD